MAAAAASEPAAQATVEAAAAEAAPRGTPCVLVIGMAGSGKSTLMQRLVAHLHQQQRPPYVVNLDPAVHTGWGAKQKSESETERERERERDRETERRGAA